MDENWWIFSCWCIDTFIFNIKLMFQQTACHIKNRSQGWFWHPWNQNFLGCCFPSKIKYLWCCKPPEPLVDHKYLFSTWNIDTACYYWKHLKKVFSVITGCVNISCREQVFLAHQRFRRLTTSWIFDFWRKTAYWKYLVPWMLKSPLTSVLKNRYRKGQKKVFSYCGCRMFGDCIR